jgi:heme-degrading monooxygenase HmoA
MDEAYYTHALWKVKEGRVEEFIAAWKSLGDVFLRIGGTAHGTLIQSLSDPTEFYSFGPWESLEAMQAMRADAEAQEAIRKVRELCDQATPGAYRVVAEIRAIS